MPEIQMHDYQDRQAHARIDALETSLSRLAVSVEHLASKVDASYTHLSDKLGNIGKTDWRALIAGVSVIVALLALGGALIVRTVESGNLQLAERQAAQVTIHSVEIKWIEKTMDDYRKYADWRMQNIEKELDRERER